jgi:hypothetical protein
MEKIIYIIHGYYNESWLTGCVKGHTAACSQSELFMNMVMKLQVPPGKKNI